MRHPQLDLITAAQAGTIFGLFERRCERSSSAEAYRQYDQQTLRWRSYSWSDMRGQVEKLAAGLHNVGLMPGDRLAILLRNSVEWVCFDLAAQAQGLIVVPLYLNDSPRNVSYVLGDSGARLLVLETASEWSSLASLRSTFSALRHIVCLVDGAPESFAPDLQWHAAKAWLEGMGDRIEQRTADAEGVATLTYTSGTTGPPKGVMLTHANILTNAEAVLVHLPSYPDDRYLSFLPLSHAFERTAGYYMPMMAGATVVFSRSVQDLAEDLRTVRPTVLISVPRIYERAYSRMQEDLQHRPKVIRRLVGKTVELGWRAFEARQRRGVGVSTSERLLGF